MDFSPLFESDNTFCIEGSNFHLEQCKNVKSVEFITLHDNNILYFVEAKRTAPNPDAPENKENVDKYFHDLTGKIQQSIDMLVSKEVGVNVDADNEFPACFGGSAFSKYKLIFLLIIRNSQKEWCSDVQTKLQRELLALRKIWKLEVIVLAGNDAIRKRFVSKFVCKQDNTAWAGYSNCPRPNCEGV